MAKKAGKIPSKGPQPILKKKTRSTSNVDDGGDPVVWTHFNELEETNKERAIRIREKKDLRFW